LRVEVAYHLPLMNPTTFIAALKRENVDRKYNSFSNSAGEMNVQEVNSARRFFNNKDEGQLWRDGGGM
jgi:hypothetical protein